MGTPMKILSVLVILAAAAVMSLPAQAKHHHLTHHHWHHRAANAWQYSNWQYSPCGAPCRPGQIDHSRPGGLDPSFTPRGK